MFFIGRPVNFYGFCRGSHDFLTFLLDGTLYSILAMELLTRNQTTPCCKFRPSYALIPGLLESSKKAASCYKRDHKQSKVIFE